MATLETVPNATTSYLTVTFYNKDGIADTPLSATWKLENETCNLVVQEATAILPIASTVEITISALLNTKYKACSIREKRKVIIVATYGVGDTLTEEYEYLISNI